MAEELISNGYVTGRVQLGVTLINIPDEETAMQYRVPEPGIYVSKVVANSDAYYSGLKAGDRLVSLNGKKIESAEQIKKTVTDSSVGDTLTFEVVRGRKNMSVPVKLTEYNSNLANFAS